MAVTALKNQYQGINAHLHSRLQNPGQSRSGWTSFHADLIAATTRALNQQLPAHYVARTEQSLQIWTEDPHTGTQQETNPRPDSAVFRTRQPTAALATAISSTNPAIRVISLKEWFAQEAITIPSTVIYRVHEHELFGEPVTRLELLSPGNKVEGSGYTGYLQNRAMALRSGTSLVELDFLHQSVSPLPGIPPYPAGEDSYPYYIAVTDRRPNQNPADTMLVYVLGVDEPLPAEVFIPLADTESLRLDCDAVYQDTYHSGRWGQHVDYQQLPERMDTYSQRDGDRIIQRMMTVLAAQERGDLEAGPFPIDPVQVAQRLQNMLD